MIKLVITEGQYKSIVESSDISNQLEFRDESYGYYGGQSNMYLYAQFLGDTVGYIDYSIYENKPHINMIKVEKEYRGRGIGEALINKLAAEFGYTNIIWGNVTSSGLRLQQKMDNIYGYDRNKIVSNHLPKDIIDKFKSISKNIYNFVKDYYHFGNKVWSQMEKYNEVDNEIDGQDPNDLADIVRWIEGAKENKNHPEEEVPYYIEEDLKNIRIEI
jgi:GNAT superfamily N-acetyltransferase